MLKIDKYNLCDLFLLNDLISASPAWTVFVGGCGYENAVLTFSRKKLCNFTHHKFNNQNVICNKCFEKALFTTDWFDGSWLDNVFFHVCVVIDIGPIPVGC